MENKKYYIIKYSSKVRGEDHRCHWNDVTDMDISDWWLELLECYKTDEGYFDPVLDFFQEISKEDFDKLNGIMG